MKYERRFALLGNALVEPVGSGHKWVRNHHHAREENAEKPDVEQGLDERESSFTSRSSVGHK